MGQIIVVRPIKLNVRIIILGQLEFKTPHKANYYCLQLAKQAFVTSNKIQEDYLRRCL